MMEKVRKWVKLTGCLKTAEGDCLYLRMQLQCLSPDNKLLLLVLGPEPESTGICFIIQEITGLLAPVVTCSFAAIHPAV